MEMEMEYSWLVIPVVLERRRGGTLGASSMI